MIKAGFWLHTEVRTLTKQLHPSAVPPYQIYGKCVGACRNWVRLQNIVYSFDQVCFDHDDTAPSKDKICKIVQQSRQRKDTVYLDD